MPTLTGNSPSREQRIQSLLLDRIGSKYERRIATEIRRVMVDASILVGNGVTPSYAAPDHAQKIKALLFSLYRDTAEIFSRHITGVQKSRLNKERAIPTTPIIDELISDWAQTYGGEKITSISDTTRDDISRIIAQGRLDGLSETEIGKLIRQIAPTKSASRAQTIARTESHGAANAVNDAAARKMGLEMVKSWVAASDARDAHVRAEQDNQNIGQDELFVVDGERLRYPGDPAGSPGNIINCRCAVVYDIV